MWQADCPGNVWANVSMHCSLNQYMPRLDLTYAPMYLSPSAGDANVPLDSKSAHVKLCNSQERQQVAISIEH